MYISLIITTYNWPESLSLVLESVRFQTIIPSEIIVADDGSDFKTKDVINNFNNDLDTFDKQSLKNKFFELNK